MLDVSGMYEGQSAQIEGTKFTGENITVSRKDPLSIPPSLHFFPEGVSNGTSRLTLEGFTGKNLLQELSQIPWSSNPARPGEWTRCHSLAPGLVLREECTSCEGCGCHYGSQFIVNDDLWEQHGNGKGRLCLLCFEERMGRRIVLEDLKPGPGMNLLAFRVCGEMLEDDQTIQRVNRWRSRRIGTIKDSSS